MTAKKQYNQIAKTIDHANMHIQDVIESNPEDKWGLNSFRSSEMYIGGKKDKRVFSTMDVYKAFDDAFGSVPKFNEKDLYVINYYLKHNPFRLLDMDNKDYGVSEQKFIFLCNAVKKDNENIEEISVRNFISILHEVNQITPVTLSITDYISILDKVDFSFNRDEEVFVQVENMGIGENEDNENIVDYTNLYHMVSKSIDRCQCWELEDKFVAVPKAGKDKRSTSKIKASYKGQMTQPLWNK